MLSLRYAIYKKRVLADLTVIRKHAETVFTVAPSDFSLRRFWNHVLLELDRFEVDKAKRSDSLRSFSDWLHLVCARVESDLNERRWIPLCFRGFTLAFCLAEFPENKSELLSRFDAMADLAQQIYDDSNRLEDVQTRREQLLDRLKKDGGAEYEAYSMEFDCLEHEQTVLTQRICELCKQYNCHAFELSPSLHIASGARLEPLNFDLVCDAKEIKRCFETHFYHMVRCFEDRDVLPGVIAFSPRDTKQTSDTDLKNSLYCFMCAHKDACPCYACGKKNISECPTCNRCHS